MGRGLRPSAHRAARSQGADGSPTHDCTDGRCFGGSDWARAADECEVAQHDRGLCNADGTDLRAARPAALQSRRRHRGDHGLAAQFARVRRRAAIEVKAANRAVRLMIGRAVRHKYGVLDIASKSGSLSPSFLMETTMHRPLIRLPPAGFLTHDGQTRSDGARGDRY